MQLWVWMFGLIAFMDNGCIGEDVGHQGVVCLGDKCVRDGEDHVVWDSADQDVLNGGNVCRECGWWDRRAGSL